MLTVREGCKIFPNILVSLRKINWGGVCGLAKPMNQFAYLNTCMCIKFEYNKNILVFYKKSKLLWGWVIVMANSENRKYG